MPATHTRRRERHGVRRARVDVRRKGVVWGTAQSEADEVRGLSPFSGDKDRKGAS
jgi:hypothetical protein